MGLLAAASTARTYPQSGRPRCTRSDTGKMNEPATIERIGWPVQLLGDFRLSAGFVGIGITRLFGGLFADFRGVGGFGNS
jgi:hypothetical protein